MREILKNTRMLIMAAVAFVAVVGIVITTVVIVGNRNEEDLSVVAKASLEKIVEIDELSTIEYMYNATTTKYDGGDTEKIEYYVAYPAWSTPWSGCMKV